MIIYDNILLLLLLNESSLGPHSSRLRSFHCLCESNLLSQLKNLLRNSRMFVWTVGLGQPYWEVLHESVLLDK